MQLVQVQLVPSMSAVTRKAKKVEINFYSTKRQDVNSPHCKINQNKKCVCFSTHVHHMQNSWGARVLEQESKATYRTVQTTAQFKTRKKSMEYCSMKERFVRNSLVFPNFPLCTKQQESENAQPYRQLKESYNNNK